MKKYYNYHTNQNWRKLLIIVGNSPNGQSTSIISIKSGFTVKKTYGFLYRMMDGGKVRRSNGLWYPVEI